MGHGRPCWWFEQQQKHSKRYKCTASHEVGLLFPSHLQKHHHILKEATKKSRKKSRCSTNHDGILENVPPPNNTESLCDNNVSCSTNSSLLKNAETDNVQLMNTTALEDCHKRKYLYKSVGDKVKSGDENDIDLSDEELEDILEGDLFCGTDGVAEHIANVFNG
ncbi:hypothetical protein ACA910_008893 [Epithemia clementina (nom. ined.)]